MIERRGDAMNVNIADRSEAITGTPKRRRRQELDLLRGIVVLALIPYHTATYFITGDWAPLHFVPGLAVQAAITLGTLVAMPLIFFVAGMGAWHSLGKRTVGAFLRERLLRLFVPLAVAHLILLPVIQYYAFRRSPLFDEAFTQFFPSFFDVTLRLVLPPSLVGPRYQLHHLWFLKDLLVYTLVLLPVLLWLQSRAGRRVVEGLAGFLCRPWAILILALPIACIEAVLGAAGAWNHFSYLLLILYGTLIASDPRCGQAIRRQWKPALFGGLALFCTVGVLGLAYFSEAGVNFQTDRGLESALFRLLKGIVVWLLLIGTLGFAGGIRLAGAAGSGTQEVRAADRSGGSMPARSGRLLNGHPGLVEKAARFFSQGVLPIYVLHLAFVIVVGFYVVQWTSVLWVRFTVITVVSAVDTLVVYDLVRRTRMTRFLFGIKPDRTVPVPEEASSQQPQIKLVSAAGSFAKSNLTQLGLLAVAVLVSLAVILGANDSQALIGRWQQTLDTVQAATGYTAEFQGDGTWTVAAEGESIGGTYVLQEDGAIEISYADGSNSVSRIEMSADRFALFSQDGDRVQVFMRSHLR
jgi:surface polysaccharide O-acyltransferase-like enzyme